MGADLLATAIPMVYSKEKALARLDRMSFEDIEIATGMTYLDEYFDDVDPDDREAVLEAEDNLRQKCREAVELIYEIYDEAHRMTQNLYIGGTFFLIVGGPSWGDSPEFYDEADLVFSLGVTYDSDAKIVWSKP